MVITALWCFYISLGLNAFVALLYTAGVASGFGVGLFTSIFLYRTLFHPLRKFPGPFWARITAFYPLSQAAKETRYHKEVAKMHQEYGDFIRTAPRELCVVRKSAVSLFFGPASECLKSTWYSQLGPDASKASIHMGRDPHLHRLRRRAWDQGFSMKALQAYLPRIEDRVNQFVSKIAQTNTPKDVTVWSMLLSFDIMGDVGLGKDFGGVSGGIEHPAIKSIHAHMEVLATMAHVPWLLEMMSHIPGVTGGYAPFFNWCSEEVKAKEMAWKPDEKPQDIMSWLLRAFKQKDATAPPSEAALHEDSRVLIIAGSETTATALACVFYFLAKYPAVQAKLQQQILTAVPGVEQWSYEKVKSVSYLDDVIKESLRLKPPLLTGGHREVPKKGIQVDEVYIPGGTNVFVPIQKIQTDPRYWKRSMEFIPERFGELKEEMRTDETTLIPFSLGQFSCPGKNLAMMSMRIAIARILQEYSISFAEGEDGKVFDRDAKDTFSTWLPALMIQFTPRHNTEGKEKF
ncbi:putative benzoate 4-monooxygenase cytochrome P450 [Thozetella sp. PMI_491]|nr:putative benzoate 4-monooxygenase cytochrome P450 [Thozetella sp. PMI_491]